MTDSAPQGTSDSEAPPSRARSTTIGAVAFVILAMPFLVFGWIMFSLKARVDLDCPGGGPCKLVHRSWLSRETVETFTVDEILGASLERNRSSKRGGEQVFRPVLETTKGKFPLSHGWMDDQKAAEGTVLMLIDMRASNISTGVIFVSDQRRGAAIVGSAFTSVGLVLLGVSVWLGIKARRYRRTERSAQSSQASRS